jgi:chemotaxis protein MotB
MERWLLTYADMITLLLALFIVLFSVSTINAKKFEALALGLRETFNPNPGVLPSSNGILNNASLVPTAGMKQMNRKQNVAPPEPVGSVSGATPAQASRSPQPGTKAQTGQQPLQQIQQQIQNALSAKGLSGVVSQSVETRGLVVRVLADRVFYNVDRADLGPVGDEVVDTIATVLATDTNDVRVEGYTDSQAITGGPYTSNMALSAARAVNVVERLIKVDGIEEARLAAIGYGPNDPVAPNTSAANMALNRRIDVTILAPGQTI